MTLRYGTAYHGLEAEPVPFETALRALAEGHSLRATARIIGVDKDTVCAWLDRGARQCRAVLVHPRSMARLPPGLVENLWGMVLSTPSRDAWASSQTPPAAAGRPAGCPGDQAPNGGRVTAISTAVVFGAPAAVAARLTHSPVSQTINTRFIERAKLTQRQQNRRLARRTNGFSKDLSWFEKQLWLSLAYYHLVLPHDSVRHPLPVPEPMRGSGSPRRWCPTTPAMAAGLTDHVWTQGNRIKILLLGPTGGG